MSGLRFTHRRLTTTSFAMLILGGVLVMMVSGCFREHLHDATGKHFFHIVDLQTQGTYSRGQAHRGMGAEMGEHAINNMYGDAKKAAAGSSGGGPQLIQLQR